MSSALWIEVPHGRSHNYTGSMAEVALLVESFSQLGQHAVQVLLCAACVLLPLYALVTSTFARPEGPASDTLRAPLAPGDEEDDGVLDLAAPPAPSPPRCLRTPSHGVRHLAVIMDGNRRFGARCLGNPLRGHERGGDALMRFIRWCRRCHVPMLTVYAFSTENWRRSEQEVAVLMALFRSFFAKIRARAAAHGIRIRFLSSEPALLPPDILRLMRDVEAETSGNVGIVVNVCVSYGARSAITHAAGALHAVGVAPTEDRLRRCLARSVNDAAPRTVAEADAPLVATVAGAALDLSGDPDVVLRTSAEKRLSNFLLFESAYAELYFLDVTWPELSLGHLVGVLNDFSAARQRRFGK